VVVQRPIRPEQAERVQACPDPPDCGVLFAEVAGEEDRVIGAGKVG
jgi:hypothetical protein